MKIFLCLITSRKHGHRFDETKQFNIVVNDEFNIVVNDEFNEIVIIASYLLGDTYLMYLHYMYLKPKGL
jgi:hypothetical protein